MISRFGVGIAEFLIVGIDQNGAHIFRVHYEGVQGGNWLEWCTKLGFRAIGTGQIHASITLATSEQHRMENVDTTLFNVYCAKKNAELAPGVGVTEDIGIISSNGIVFIDGLQLAELHKERKAFTIRRRLKNEKKNSEETAIK
jgi:hypothetical protein